MCHYVDLRRSCAECHLPAGRPSPVIFKVLHVRCADTSHIKWRTQRATQARCACFTGWRRCWDASRCGRHADSRLLLCWGWQGRRRPARGGVNLRRLSGPCRRPWPPARPLASDQRPMTVPRVQMTPTSRPNGRPSWMEPCSPAWTAWTAALTAWGEHGSTQPRRCAGAGGGRGLLLVGAEHADSNPIQKSPSALGWAWRGPARAQGRWKRAAVLPDQPCTPGRRWLIQAAAAAGCPPGAGRQK